MRKKVFTFMLESSCDYFPDLFMELVDFWIVDFEEYDIWEAVAKRQRKFYSLERLVQSHPSAMLSPIVVNSVSKLVVDGYVGQAFSVIDDVMRLIANSIRNGVQGTVPADDVLRVLAAYIRS